MRKQAITFLSLFTLILVLSIYYLLVPPFEEEKTNLINKEPNAEKILFGGEEITDIKENATYYARYSKTYIIKFDLNQ